ncbi:type II secretion system GspH family protein [Nitrospinaceae bacterium]|nr:type II secretion system GspH family protein [Nitrospinaceae bacterium]
MQCLRGSNQGFTLLELILSLVIIGFIVTISLGAIRLGASAQETGQLKIDTFQRLRLIQNQLGQKIKSNYPVFTFREKTIFAPKNSQEKPKRLLSFEGKNNSLRFVTFSSPLTSQGKSPWLHETIFYVGEHPKSGKSGIIMAERTVAPKKSTGSVFNKIDKDRLFLLAEDVDYLKFRYYQMRKLSPAETKLLLDKSKKYEGHWVTSVGHNAFKTNAGELIKEQQTRLNFEENNKMTLPRAVEVTLALKELTRSSSKKESRIIFSPPIIIPLYSGMRFALPLEHNENI